MLQVFRFEYLKFRILEILNFDPCITLLFLFYSDSGSLEARRSSTECSEAVDATVTP